MHSVYYKRAPKIFNKFFKHLNELHNYQTRQVDTSTYFLLRVNKQFAQNQISYRGTKLWATIPATIKNKGFHSFKQLFRKHMLSNLLNSNGITNSFFLLSSVDYFLFLFRLRNIKWYFPIVCE